ncbi:Uncharacterised protein [Mycobacterium tuberculosis]|nr:Uncharacterised protein [Mycobacterium tuberculosis]
MTDQSILQQSLHDCVCDALGNALTNQFFGQELLKSRLADDLHLANSDVTSSASLALHNVPFLNRKTSVDHVVDLRWDTLKEVGKLTTLNLD